MLLPKSAKIYVAGHNGMVGSALIRILASCGYDNIVCKSSEDLDLTCQSNVDLFFNHERPDCVFMAAARVGGIVANMNNQAEFLYENMMMEMNTIRSAVKYGVPHFMFIGSVCVYPWNAPQPLKEDYLETGPFEPLDEGYAIAKLAGLKYCDFINNQYGLHYISVMPTNLYGPKDNYNPANSHVIPGMIRRFHVAKTTGADTVSLWGTGTPTRDFLYVDDLAEACVFLMNHYEGPGTVNVGTGIETTIADLALAIKDVVGFEGNILFDSSKPDGTPRRFLDAERIHSLGWTHTTSLQDGLQTSYRDFLAGTTRESRIIEKHVCDSA